MTKIVSALLILLMSLAGCEQNKISRTPTAKLSSGPEDLHPSSPKLCSGGHEGCQSFPSAPLQVCSPAASLHTTDDEEEDEEARERRVYELTKSEFNSNASSLLVTLLFRNKLTPLQARVVTDILVERMRCRPEEIPYTYYKFFSSSYLLCILSDSCTSAEERETIRRILEERGEDMTEP
ncbi:MAG: hypothetical protein LBL16_00195 [Endomicrobium sp.]|jgi:hypothetical protein|nr:hypothetical protein [Endomicrobium sp.]